MLRLSSRCTGPLGIFTPTSLRCSGAVSRGTTARTISRALLVQSQDRRNAENLSESVGVSARAMQRFLTKAPWDDDAVMGRLQEYLSPRLGHPEAVWVLDGSDFPKQGRKSAGVSRQYCGRLGKVANCQAGMFLAYVSPLGRALVDKRLYLPESWTSEPGAVRRRVYQNTGGTTVRRRSWPWRCWRGPWSWAISGPSGLPETTPSGMSPSFREGLVNLGMWYVLDVPGGTTAWPMEPAWTSPEYQGSGRPRKPRLVDGQRRTMEQRSDELPDEAWREITVAEGSQGAALLPVQRPADAADPSGASPARSTGPSTAGTWTAASPRVGGATTGDLSILKSTNDLSPRGRGNQSKHEYAEAVLRSIPAWAGPGWPSSRPSARRSTWVISKSASQPVNWAPSG